MKTEVSVAPSVEPVDLADVKIHLRVDISDDDTLINSYITTAREYVEKVTRRALITRTMIGYIDCFPGVNFILLPDAPLQSITSLVYTDGAGDDTTFDSGNYSADTICEPGRLVLGYNKSWPSVTSFATVNPIAITYVAGYGDASTDVAEIYKQVILLLVGSWYENREAIIATGAVPQEIRFAVENLLMIDRVWQ